MQSLVCIFLLFGLTESPLRICLTVKLVVSVKCVKETVSKKSVQSYWPSGSSAPGPPSSQQPSEASAGIPMRVTVLMQRAGGAASAGDVDAGGGGGLETGGCGGEHGMRGAQSKQSAPYAHIGNSEPGLSQ